jgi:type I restriction enzyme, R subunit
MFNELNTVEQLVIDESKKLGWKYKSYSDLGRKDQDVLVEDILRKQLEKLNPTIKEKPNRADEILYKLRAIIISVRGTGLVRTNEEFSKWLKNEKTMPFGERGQHVSIKLIDYEKINKNSFIVTSQYSFTSGQNRRPDIVFLVNGIPLVIGEAKTPIRESISWFDGALQLLEYQNSISQLFVPNVFMFATEGKTYRGGAVKLPVEKWQPWRTTKDSYNLHELKRAVELMLRPEAVLDILQNFTAFSTLKGGLKIKILCRYQQHEATKQIVERVIEGKIKKGLIWHFQGSGKSILMVYAAQQLRKEPKLKSPTVLVVVDRIDLNSQIGATFNASNVPNTVIADSREELHKLLSQDTRKIIITTIHKFAESEGILNERENIIVLVDEAHRTQEGDLGQKMRGALPNAFLFGLTGTPINKRDRNTFYAFGAKEDKTGYMNKYSFQQSMKDKATIPIDFEPRLVELHVKQEDIKTGYKILIEKAGLEYGEKDSNLLSKHAAKFGNLVKSKRRVKDVCADIVQHFKEYIEPNNFKGQVVVFDRNACDLYKKEIDKHMNPEESAVVMTTNNKDPKEWRDNYTLSDDDQEKLLDRFRDPKDPLKLLIVTSKLLTGFDAPINKVMYLDKPMKDHTLLQAICRVNRPYPNKERGLIVDYLGIFDDVAQALDFDLKEIKNVISNISELKDKLPGAIKQCLSYFKDIDRTVEGYEGLQAAQECLPNDNLRDKFGGDYSFLNRHWEAISPDPMLKKYENEYKWLTEVYQSLRPPSGRGKLIWHTLGEKTLKLIHENVVVQRIRDDLDKLVMDENILEQIKGDPEKEAKKIEIKIVWRLHKHPNDPRFIELGKRLEELREQHYRNALASLDLLNKLLELAREVVALERDTKAEPVDDSKEALTQVLNECKIEQTPKIIEKIVVDIDSMVKITRFPEWQWTIQGEREIQKALRDTLLKYKLHKNQELFDKAYAYIREHY